MVRHRIGTLARLVLILMALTWGFCAGYGQSSNGQAPASRPPGQTKGCVVGLKKCVGNDARWDAAIRNANRRAADMRAKGLVKGKK